MFDDLDLIYHYSRAQALEDGVLVDETAAAKEAGFLLPLALTQALHLYLTPSPHGEAHGQSYAGRLWDVLWMASFALRVHPKRKELNRLPFKVLFLRYPEPTYRPQQEEKLLTVVVGPGDAGEPVLTLGFPQDF